MANAGKLSPPRQLCGEIHWLQLALQLPLGVQPNVQPQPEQQPCQDGLEFTSVDASIKLKRLYPAM